MTDYGEAKFLVSNVETFSGQGFISLRNCTRGTSISGSPTQSVNLEARAQKLYTFVIHVVIHQANTYQCTAVVVNNLGIETSSVTFAFNTSET